MAVITNTLINNIGTAVTDNYFYQDWGTSSSTTSNNQLWVQSVPVPLQGGGVISSDPPRREFNKYVNASDLLETFIQDMGALGLSQKEFLDLPVNAFITWLVLKAAVADGEDPLWRCGSCGRFTKDGLVACGPTHARRLLAA